MNDDTTFRTEEATIDLEQVAAFEEVASAEGERLNVYLKNGATVPVRGEEDVQEFVEALEELLE